jgi:hypothetical protein
MDRLPPALLLALIVALAGCSATQEPIRETSWPYVVPPEVVGRVGCRPDEAGVAEHLQFATRDLLPSKSGKESAAMAAAWREYNAEHWVEALTWLQSVIDGTSADGPRTQVVARILAAHCAFFLTLYPYALALAESVVEFASPDVPALVLTFTDWPDDSEPLLLTLAKLREVPAVLGDHAVDVSLRPQLSRLRLMTCCFGPACGRAWDERWFFIGRGLYRAGRYAEALAALARVKPVGGYAGLAAACGSMILQSHPGLTPSSNFEF